MYFSRSKQLVANYLNECLLGLKRNAVLPSTFPSPTDPVSHTIMKQTVPQHISTKGHSQHSIDTISPTRRIYVVAVFAVLCMLFFFYRDILGDITVSRTATFQSPNSFTHEPITTSPHLPQPLSKVLTPHVGPVHEFTVPHLVSYYEDELPNEHTRLYLITAGIMMEYSQRNFSAVGCLVGRDVYPARRFVSEVVQCNISRRLQPGEKLAPVVAYDEYVKRAEEGPVKLRSEVIAELFPGDLTELADDTVLHGDLSQSQLSEFRTARSDVRVGSSDHLVREEAKFRPRYQLCQMTMVAPNSHMIKDWAEYHRRIGVDKVFIFDNGAELDLKQMFEGRPDIEVVDWPYDKSQVAAVSTFLLMSRARCERIFMHDSDEYAMFGLGDGTCLTTGERPMIRYVKKAWKKGFGHAMLLYVTMANSGFHYRPKGEVPMNYIHRREEQPLDNGKSICSTDANEWEAAAIHLCGYSGNGFRVPIWREGIKKWGDLKMMPENVDDPPFLLHFRYRSWEEWVQKWDAGRVSGKQVSDKKKGLYSVEKPIRGFLDVNPKYEYKHFRDKIYSRVMKEGRADEQVIVQTKDGKRCVMVYRIVGSDVKGPLREKCS